VGLTQAPRIGHAGGRQRCAGGLSAHRGGTEHLRLHDAPQRAPYGVCCRCPTSYSASYVRCTRGLECGALLVSTDNLPRRELDVRASLVVNRKAAAYGLCAAALLSDWGPPSYGL